jgi:hypothetical protein
MSGGLGNSCLEVTTIDWPGKGPLLNCEGGQNAHFAHFDFLLLRQMPNAAEAMLREMRTRRAADARLGLPHEVFQPTP